MNGATSRQDLQQSAVTSAAKGTHTHQTEFDKKLFIFDGCVSYLSIIFFSLVSIYF